MEAKDHLKGNGVTKIYLYVDDLDKAIEVRSPFSLLLLLLIHRYKIDSQFFCITLSTNKFVSLLEIGINGGKQLSYIILEGSIDNF